MSKLNIGDNLFEVSPTDILSVQGMLDLNIKLFMDTMHSIQSTRTIIDTLAPDGKRELINDETRAMMQT